MTRNKKIIIGDSTYLVTNRLFEGILWILEFSTKKESAKLVENILIKNKNQVTKIN